MIQTKSHADQNESDSEIDYRDDGSPRFPTPERWLGHFEHATRNGHRPWPPCTRSELMLADERGLLEIYPQWIPGRIGLRLLNLPDHFGRTLEPYSERFKERFLATLIDDVQLRSVLRSLLMEGGQ